MSETETETRRDRDRQRQTETDRKAETDRDRDRRRDTRDKRREAATGGAATLRLLLVADCRSPCLIGRGRYGSAFLRRGQAEQVLDLYAAVVGHSAVIDALLEKLRAKLLREVALQQELLELEGIMEMLMAGNAARAQQQQPALDTAAGGGGGGGTASSAQ